MVQLTTPSRFNLCLELVAGFKGGSSHIQTHDDCVEDALGVVSTQLFGIALVTGKSSG